VPTRALDGQERSQVLAVLNSDRFVDAAPRQVYARLLDEGLYLCSWRTMYRILDTHQQVRERRDQLTHPAYKKPELLAKGPNQVWSWDITKLRGPQKWTYFYLYVLMDIFSRFVVGWMVARQESAELAKELIGQSCQNQEIDPDTLTIHSDRGGPMTAKSLALLLSDLGVTKSHARPHVPDDNPFSEAHFKTMKYRPDYPDRFGSLEDVRTWGRRFFSWYNFEHYHTGLGLMRPATVHYGQAIKVQAQRQRVLEAAYAAHPERFVKGTPTASTRPEAVWINKPKSEQLAREILQ
jgi:putative transposase